jgi:hypothetical protein
MPLSLRFSRRNFQIRQSPNFLRGCGKVPEMQGLWIDSDFAMVRSRSFLNGSSSAGAGFR